MKIQFTREARGIFADVIQALEGLQRQKFTDAVQKTYDSKITSEHDLKEYRITDEDIRDVLRDGQFINAPIIINKQNNG